GKSITPRSILEGQRGLQPSEYHTPTIVLRNVDRVSLCCVPWGLAVVIGADSCARCGMTTSEAQELRQRWNQRSDSTDCSHRHVALESGHNGCVTGFYVCLVCGQKVLRRITLDQICRSANPFPAQK